MREKKKKRSRISTYQQVNKGAKISEKKKQKKTNCLSNQVLLCPQKLVSDLFRPRKSDTRISNLFAPGGVLSSVSFVSYGRERERKETGILY